MKKIDIVSFLNNYYGIYHSSLRKNKLTHEDISELFPFIKTCKDKDFIKDNLDNGNIIMVCDKTKAIKYYINPHLKEREMYDSLEEKEETKDIISLDNLDKLSIDELLSLRKRLRKNDERKRSYLINKFIHRRKELKPIIYKKKKEKILLKESMYD